VIGDVVNVASRLESLTRQLDSQLVVSDAVVEAIRATPGLDPGAALADLRQAVPQSLRGRRQPVTVWRLPRTDL
jgi:adenylate cyclase